MKPSKLSALYCITIFHTAIATRCGHAFQKVILWIFLLAAYQAGFSQAPAISSFSPTQAPTGATIIITGTNFTGSTAVSFGGTAAASFTVVSATQISAVVAGGSNGSVAVTNGSGTGTKTGFYYQALNRVITDFGGYWSSSLLSPNGVKPDNSHNVLAFGYNNVIYSTGVNDARLTSNSVSYTASSFRALPVASISGINPGGSVYLALAKLVDGSANVANASAVSNYTLKSVLTDGVQGLDLGTGFTNLPASAFLSFSIYSINNAKIADAEPDILLTQIAQPSAGNDVFSLVDASGTLVGNTITQDMTQLSPFGTYDLDLFNLTPNAPFNSATAFSASAANTNREIRLVAFKLSDFGITAGNAAQVKALKITPSTNSDYAFIGYNTNALNLPPNISQNSYNSNTNICSGGNAAMEVIGTAANGGSLTYSWERSVNGGSTWTTVTNGGNFSGATTTRLVVANAVNADQYRATVTEAVSNYTNTSAAFTIAVITPTAPSSVTVAGGATVCLNNAVQLTSSVSGGSNLYYQWQSAPAPAGTYSDISGAMLNYYIPPVSATGAIAYRVVVSSGSGCGGAVTAATPATVTVTGISTATPASRCGTGAVTLIAAATSGTIDWYTTDAGGTSLYTGTNYTTASISTSTTYYVNSSGCASGLRVAVTATVNGAGQWTGGSSGDWNTAANWCGGVPTASTNVNIPAGTMVSIQSSNALANSVSIAPGGSLVMTGAYNLTITGGGSFTNNGSFTAASSTGSLVFAGNGTISGTTTFKNIDTYGALDFGTASTVSGNFTLLTGGSVTGHSPNYTCPTSTLLYKPGSTFTRGLEWTNVSSGAGFPANVVVQNNTIINFPAGGNGYVCYDLQIDAGSALKQNFGGGSAGLGVGRNVTINGTLELGSTTGGDISLGGNWVRNTGGVFTHNNRKVTFDGPANFSGNGTSMASISAPAATAKNNEGGFGGENFAQLWISKTNATDSVVLLSNITVNKELGFTKGTFSLRNSDVTLVSNSSRTADIAPITTVANVNLRYGGSGRFVIQRFIQNPTAVRSWRLLTAPLEPTTAPSLNEAFQEGVVNPDKNNPNANGGIYNPWPGYGVHITGPGGAYNLANGFDQGSNSSSILYANPGITSWLSPSSTTGTKLSDYQGWMLFVRGDRGFVIGNQYTPSQNTTLEPRGKIIIGDVSVPVAATKQVIGNPYAAAISLLNVNVAGATGANSNYYLWDPKYFTSYTQPGKWVAFSGTGSSFVQTTSASAYPSNGTIESGQAFVIDAPAAGNITFHETDKQALTSSLVGIANRPSGSPGFASFRTDMYVENNGEYTLTDGVLNIFDADYDNATTAADAKKLVSFNTKESLSILRGDAPLAIEKRSFIEAEDTIFYNLSKLNELSYRFKFEVQNFNPAIKAYLEDQFTGMRFPVSISGATAVDFTITPNPLSKAADRFRVVFKADFGTVLPVTFTDVTAARQRDKIAVQWTVANELNIKSYEVQKSYDGIHFEKAAVIAAGNDYDGSNVYSWLDEKVAQGANYYRIVSKGIDGTGISSKVVMELTNKSNGSISVYPNPVTDGDIQLHFTEMEKGNYNTMMLNEAGQVVLTTSIDYSGGDQIRVIRTGKTITTGIYHLQIIGPRGLKTVITVIIN